MNAFVGSVIALALIWIGTITLIRRNLRQRPLARKYREIFMAAANDLVSKAEFPDRHAKQLVAMAAIREGWMTRFMLCLIVKRTFFPPRSKSSGPNVEQVPKQLQAKYVVALLAFVLSDSYRCALLGRVLRGIYPWFEAALAEVKPDVNAHATKMVVEQISQMHTPKRLQRVQERAFA